MAYICKGHFLLLARGNVAFLPCRYNFLCFKMNFSSWSYLFHEPINTIMFHSSLNLELFLDKIKEHERFPSRESVVISVFTEKKVLIDRKDEGDFWKVDIYLISSYLWSKIHNLGFHYNLIWDWKASHHIRTKDLIKARTYKHCIIVSPFGVLTSIKFFLLRICK